MLLNCSNNQALVTWAPEPHATSFSVITTTTGAPSASCSSTNTSCVLNNLLCGRRYTGQAVAQGNQCTSVPSTSFEILTGVLKALLFESIYLIQN